MSEGGSGGWALAVAVILAGVMVLRVIWRRRSERWENERREMQALVGELRKEVERTQAEAEAQQRSVLDGMIEGVLVLGPDRRILVANDAVVKLFGLPANLRGRRLIEVLRQHELDALSRRALEHRTAMEMELVVTGAGEKVLHVTVSAVGRSSQAGGGTILVFHDLTRMKQLERMRSDFVANVSHELRTPVSIIKGYVETLLQHRDGTPELRIRALGAIQKHTDRLAFLIEDLLTLSELESGGLVLELETVSMAGLVEATFEDLRTSAEEKGIRLESAVAEGLMVEADRIRLQQVVWNLVENAIKYGKPGGYVEVGGAHRASEQEIEMWVRDDGHGIPVEAQARVFERFFRVDRARSRESGGTGLGLSIVKHIVQLHGGNLWVESEPGEGSTFFVRLPQGQAASTV